MVMYEVWARLPGEKRAKLIDTFTRERWQWAEKLKQYLIDHDCNEVEVRRVEG